MLAAAIRGQASVIVTFNLSDFPPDALRAYGMEVQHPDDFVSHLLDLDEVTVVEAVRRQRESLRHPIKTADELLSTLEQLGLAQTAARLRRFTAWL